MTTKKYYRDQQAWKELQKFLPERLRLSDGGANPTPEEDFWEWKGHTIHLDRFRNSDAKAKVILHHGVGTNGRQMTMILGAPLAALGYEVIAIDNLGYGMTSVKKGATFDYGDWIDLMVDFLAVEKSRDDRPIVLYGLSAGGMLTYHVAAAAPQNTLAGIAGMTFLDERVQFVRDETAHDILTSRIGIPAMNIAAKTPLARMPYPMALASKMSALANDPGAMKVFMKDRTSAANWMSLGFLATYMNYRPAVEAADFDACPVLHMQPAEDRWTPYEVSVPVTHHITKVPVTEVTLDNAGHYPLEDPGLRQMVEAMDSFIATTTTKH